MSSSGLQATSYGLHACGQAARAPFGHARSLVNVTTSLFYIKNDITLVIRNIISKKNLQSIIRVGAGLI
jgi:hypothetical protein